VISYRPCAVDPEFDQPKRQQKSGRQVILGKFDWPMLIEQTVS